eukprot:5729407-Pyramimonas_sp.AAC.1
MAVTDIVFSLFSPTCRSPDLLPIASNARIKRGAPFCQAPIWSPLGRADPSASRAASLSFAARARNRSKDNQPTNALAPPRSPPACRSSER